MKSENRFQLPSLGLVAVTVVVSTFASLAMAFSRPAEINVDGNRVVSDVPPVTKGSEAYVPLRAISDGMGATTTYDKKTGVVEVIRNGDTLRLHVNDRHATLNGSKMTLAHVPFTVRGRVMVSMHTLNRALGSTVHYDARQAKIDVTTPGIVAAGTDGGQ